MKSDFTDSHDSSAKAGQSQWLRFLKRDVFRRRFVLKVLLTLLRVLADLQD